MKSHQSFTPHLARTIVAFATSVCACLPASAAQAPNEAGVVRLTVDDTVARAMAASHRIAESRARTDAAEAVVASRDAAAKPSVVVQAGYTRTNHVDEYGITIPGQAPRIIYPDVPDNWRSRVEVQWPVYTSGRLAAFERAAYAEREATESDASVLKLDIRLDAVRAYWTLVMARNTVRVVDASVNRVTSHLKDVTQMLAVGLAAPNDVLMAEARRARERLALIEARNAQDVAEADLRRLTGLDAEARIDLVESVPDDGAVMPGVADLLKEAMAGRAERRALEQRLASVGGRRAAAKAATRPTVALIGGADYAKPNTRIFPRADEWNATFDVGVSVSWMAWDAGRAKAEVSEADANRRVIESRIAEFDRVLAFEVTQRSLDLESARAAVTAARDGERAAVEANRVVGERFKAGLATSTEVLDAQVALAQAQLDVTRAETSVRLARARLQRTIGR